MLCCLDNDDVSLTIDFVVIAISLFNNLPVGWMGGWTLNRFCRSHAEVEIQWAGSGNDHQTANRFVVHRFWKLSGKLASLAVGQLKNMQGTREQQKPGFPCLPSELQTHNQQQSRANIPVLYTASNLLKWKRGERLTCLSVCPSVIRLSVQPAVSRIRDDDITHSQQQPS